MPDIKTDLATAMIAPRAGGTMLVKGWLPLAYQDYKGIRGLTEKRRQLDARPWVGIMNPEGEVPALLLSHFLLDDDEHGTDEHIELVQARDDFVTCRWLGRSSTWGSWLGQEVTQEASRIYMFTLLPKRLLRVVEELWGPESPFLHALTNSRRVPREMRLHGLTYMQLTYPLFQ